MASSTVACARWNSVGLDECQVEVGDEGVVTPVGPERSLARIGEPGAAHDQADAALGRLAASAGHVDGLGHLGRTAVGIGDGDARRTRRWRRCRP